MNNRKKKPTRRRPAEIRALLLKAAESVFKEKGFVATTADEIAIEAGVARSAMYRHFTNKSDLFRHALLVPFMDFIKEYSEAWQSQLAQPWDDEHLMETMVGLFYDSFETHRDTLLAIAAASSALDKQGTEELDNELEKFFATMFSISKKEIIRRGWMSLESLDLTIRLTLGSIAASIVLSRLFLVPGHKGWTRDDIVRQISALTLHGLRLASAPPSATPKAGGKNGARKP